MLPSVPPSAWLPAFGDKDHGFRNRAKLVVGGSAGRVTLGILGPDGRGVDLRECLIQDPLLADAIPLVASFLEATNLPPYSVPDRAGELKFVHLTVSPSAELMVRFVVRTEASLEVIHAHLPRLRSSLPQAVVVSVNLLPEHKAVLEGEREVTLLGESLTMHLGGSSDELNLHLLPKSFFQTNTLVAQQLYAQVTEWIRQLRPTSLWDLYCGVGGFALHAAVNLHAQGIECDVLGVELNESAVLSARRSARETNISAEFVAADALEFALNAPVAHLPQLVVVNPPRRGIGDALAQWIEASRIPTVVYSSCNPVTLAKDLALMPSYGVSQAKMFDMFPHTAHLEVAVLLTRQTD